MANCGSSCHHANQCCWECFELTLMSQTKNKQNSDCLNCDKYVFFLEHFSICDILFIFIWLNVETGEVGVELKWDWAFPHECTILNYESFLKSTGPVTKPLDKHCGALSSDRCQSDVAGHRGRTRWSAARSKRDPGCLRRGRTIVM